MQLLASPKIEMEQALDGLFRNKKCTSSFMREVRILSCCERQEEGE